MYQFHRLTLHKFTYTSDGELLITKSNFEIICLSVIYIHSVKHDFITTLIITWIIHCHAEIYKISGINCIIRNIWLVKFYCYITAVSFNPIRNSNYQLTCLVGDVNCLIL